MSEKKNLTPLDLPLFSGPSLPGGTKDPSCSLPTPPSCCGPENRPDNYPYLDWPFITGGLDHPLTARKIPRISTTLTRSDILGRWRVRWGWGRYHYRVRPGLYAIGQPDEKSPVLVTANYKLTLDAVRRELTGLDAWILVLNTRGINVWCAAGKKTFSASEVIGRVQESGLARIVSHRQIILPQLSAPGVCAALVKQVCGFSVVYGPVRARDIKEFIKQALKATSSMRQVFFPIRDRLALVPMEVTGMLKPSLWVIPALFFLSGIGPGLFSLTAAWQRGTIATMMYLCGLFSGAVLTPLLLPWLPGAAFAVKGAVTGILMTMAAFFLVGPGKLDLPVFLLAISGVSSVCAMNFTGASTYTSPSGVEKEMRRAIPLQGIALLGAGIMWVGLAFIGK